MSQKARLLVLGAGPVGLEAALAGVDLGYDVRLLEAGRAGEGISSWGHVKMFSPWGMNCSPLGLRALEREGRTPFDDPAASPSGREYVARYLVPLRQSAALREIVRERTRVVAIGRHATMKQDLPGEARTSRPFRVLAERRGRAEIHEADVLIDATGALARPRPLGNGGIPAPGEREAARLIHRGIPDLDDARVERRFAGRRILLVGGGHSAATSAIALSRLAARHPRTRVLWARRQARRPPYARLLNDPLPLRDEIVVEANQLASGADRRIEPLPGCVIDAIARRGGRGPALQVTLREGERLRRECVDAIIANVGASPDDSIHAELQAHMCYATSGSIKLAAALLGENSGDCLAQPAPSAELVSHPEPGFFILGSKSYGRTTTFLIQSGFEQVRAVFAALAPPGRVETRAPAGRRAAVSRASDPGRSSSPETRA